MHMTDDDMNDVLNRISSLYESLVRALLIEEPRPSCYAIFIPYHSWRMPPADNARESQVLSFLDLKFKEMLDRKAYDEPYYYSFGSFFGEVDEVKLDSADLHAALLEWYTYMQSNRVEMDDKTVAARLGKAVASACRKLNSLGFNDNDNRFTANFVVFTDYIEPTSGMPGLADCVSDDWLRDQKARNLVADRIKKSLF